MNAGEQLVLRFTTTNSRKVDVYGPDSANLLSVGANSISASNLPYVATAPDILTVKTGAKQGTHCVAIDAGTGTQRVWVQIIPPPTYIQFDKNNVGIDSRTLNPAQFSLANGFYGAAYVYSNLPVGISWETSVAALIQLEPNAFTKYADPLYGLTLSTVNGGGVETNSNIVWLDDRSSQSYAITTDRGFLFVNAYRGTQGIVSIPFYMGAKKITTPVAYLIVNPCTFGTTCVQSWDVFTTISNPQLTILSELLQTTTVAVTDAFGSTIFNSTMPAYSQGSMPLPTLQSGYQVRVTGGSSPVNFQIR